MSVPQRSVVPDEEFATSDMARVTWLKMQGIEYEAMQKRNGTCYWIYRVSQEILDFIEQFEEGEAVVEIRTYNKEFQRVRKAFYRFTDGERVYRE